MVLIPVRLRKETAVCERCGFTLLELMAVIIIVSILAVIAVAQIMGALEKTRTSEAVSILGDLAKSQFRYYVTFGKLTDDTADLDCAYTAPKFFFAPLAFDPLYTGGNEIIGSMSRNARANTIYGNYVMQVSSSGAITCDDNSGADRCPPGF